MSDGAMESADTGDSLSPERTILALLDRRGRGESLNDFDDVALVNDAATEIRRLQTLLAVALEPRLRSLHFENGEVEIALEPNLVVTLIADSLMKFLDDKNAQNYVEQHFVSADHGDIALIVVRPGRKSPHQLRLEAEADVVALRERLESIGHEGSSSRSFSPTECEALEEAARCLEACASWNERMRAGVKNDAWGIEMDAWESQRGTAAAIRAMLASTPPERS